MTAQCASVNYSFGAAMTRGDDIIGGIGGGPRR